MGDLAYTRTPQEKVWLPVKVTKVLGPMLLRRHIDHLRSRYNEQAPAVSTDNNCHWPLLGPTPPLLDAPLPRAPLPVRRSTQTPRPLETFAPLVHT